MMPREIGLRTSQKSGKSLGYFLIWIFSRILRQHLQSDMYKAELYDIARLLKMQKNILMPCVLSVRG